MTTATARQRNLARAVTSAPEWLPHCFDESGSMLSFYWVPVDERRRLPFLRPDWFGDECQCTSVPVDDLAAELAGTPAVPLHFIFHTAFCGSTLLLNALDALDGCAGLKEPSVFTNLAHRLNCGENFARTGRLELVLRLLSHPLDQRRTIVAKPACFATPLMPAIMQSTPSARAVLLFSDVRTFLLSVAKRGHSGQAWGRQAFIRGLRDGAVRFRYTVAELLEQTDLRAAGLAWLMRVHDLRRMAAEFGPDRAMLLNVADFLGSPRETLGKVADFLQIATDETALSRVAESEVFSRHSKEGRGYCVDQRRAELDAARSAHGEVEGVALWVEKVAVAHGL